MTTLVLVESPAKAKTIEKYLGPGYKVIGTAGHIRDLPTKREELPDEIKDEAWAYLAVNPETFRPYYIINPNKKSKVQEIRNEVKKADRVLYATDDDREGEAISWHVAQVLGDKDPQRVVFKEITKEAVLKGVANPRPLDRALVQAQEARRIIDRLAGFLASERIRKSMRKGISTGRLQAPTLCILAQNEMNIMRFKPASFYTLKARAETTPPFRMKVTLLNKGGNIRPLVSGKDFDSNGALKNPDTVYELSQQEAEELSQVIENTPGEITNITEKDQSISPKPPFTTSTLNQAAGRIGLDIETITKIAQKLYEDGYISYIRTDSTMLSEEAIENAREAIEKKYGKDKVPDEGRQYKTKNKNAQEAHEAIRPSIPFREPASTDLSGDELKVYTLVYQRTIASQMINAEYFATTLTAECGPLTLQAQGRVMKEAGYTLAFADDTQDTEEEGEGEEEGQLPNLKVGEQFKLSSLPPEENTSKAPGRFSETSLTKYLEDKGIGRPSTYATLIVMLQKRGYTTKSKGQLALSTEGLLASIYIARYIPDLGAQNFTATMEEGLDEIATKGRNPREYLETFWTQGLAKVIQTAPIKAPVIALPHLPGVRLYASPNGPMLNHEGKDYPMPETLTPASLTDKDIKSIASGTFKSEKTKADKPRKEKSEKTSKPRASRKKS